MTRVSQCFLLSLLLYCLSSFACSLFECSASGSNIHAVVLGSLSTPRVAFLMSNFNANFGALGNGISLATPEMENVVLTGAWQMVTVTLNTQQQVKYYINGSLIATGKSGSFPSIVSRPNCWLGKTTLATSPTPKPFRGQLALVQFFRRPLQASEVMHLALRPPPSIAWSQVVVTQIPIGIVPTQVVTLGVYLPTYFGIVTYLDLAVTTGGTIGNNGNSALRLTFNSTQVQYVNITANLAATFQPFTLSFVLSGDTSHLYAPSPILFQIPTAEQLMAHAPFAVNFTTPNVHANRTESSACRPGPIGSFNGVDQYLNLTLAQDIDGSSPMPVIGGAGRSWSIVTWFVAQAYTNGSVLFESRTNDVVLVSIHVTTRARAQLEVVLGAPGPNRCTITSMLPVAIHLDRWYHLVLMFATPDNGATFGRVDLFLDGVVVAATGSCATFTSGGPASTAPPNTRHFIGASTATTTPTPSDGFWKGLIARFSIFQRALLPQEIDILYTQRPSTIYHSNITLISPNAGAFDSTVTLQLHTDTSLFATPYGCSSIDLDRIVYGPSGVGSVCASSTLISTSQVRCELQPRVVPLAYPIYFTVIMTGGGGGIPSFISPVSYSSFGSVTQLWNNSLAHVTFPVPPLTSARWAVGPSALPGTGVVVMNGTRGEWVNLNEIEIGDTHLAQPFPSLLTPRPTTGFTLNLWLRDDTPTNFAAVPFFYCATPSDPAYNGLLISRVAVYDLAFSFTNSVGSQLSYCRTTSQPLMLETWQMLTVTQDAAMVVRLYRNGALVASCFGEMFPLAVSRSQCGLGSSTLASHKFNLTGSVAEFTVWERPLQQHELVALHAQTPTSLAPIEFQVSGAPLGLVHGQSAPIMIRLPAWFGANVTIGLTGVNGTVAPSTIRFTGLQNHTFVVTATQLPMIVSFQIVQADDDLARYRAPKNINIQLASQKFIDTHMEGNEMIRIGGSECDFYFDINVLLTIAPCLRCSVCPSFLPSLSLLLDPHDIDSRTRLPFRDRDERHSPTRVDEHRHECVRTERSDRDQ